MGATGGPPTAGGWWAATAMRGGTAGTEGPAGRAGRAGRAGQRPSREPPGWRRSMTRRASRPWRRAPPSAPLLALPSRRPPLPLPRRQVGAPAVAGAAADPTAAAGRATGTPAAAAAVAAAPPLEGRATGSGRRRRATPALAPRAPWPSPYRVVRGGGDEGRRRKGAMGADASKRRQSLPSPRPSSAFSRLGAAAPDAGPDGTAALRKQRFCSGCGGGDGGSVEGIFRLPQAAPCDHFCCGRGSRKF